MGVEKYQGTVQVQPITDVAKALKHLAKKDPMMKKIIARVGEVRLEPTDDYFKCLVYSIISQLVSSKAADTVILRMNTYCSHLIDPNTLVQIDTETYRTFGIGPQKSGYIRSLAQAFLEDADSFAQLHQFEDKEVVKRLTAIKGVGKWTAEMFLIFGLGRPDVFAPDDLGLRNAMIRHFNIGEAPSRKELIARAEYWAPYRSVASILLWRSLSVMD
jgi:DNA-3-methyladenine glycosylase II